MIDLMGDPQGTLLAVVSDIFKVKQSCINERGRNKPDAEMVLPH